MVEGFVAELVVKVVMVATWARVEDEVAAPEATGAAQAVGMVAAGRCSSRHSRLGRSAPSLHRRGWRASRGKCPVHMLSGTLRRYSS